MKTINKMQEISCRGSNIDLATEYHNVFEIALNITKKGKQRILKMFICFDKLDDPNEKLTECYGSVEGYFTSGIPTDYSLTQMLKYFENIIINPENKSWINDILLKKPSFYFEKNELHSLNAGSMETDFINKMIFTHKLDLLVLFSLLSKNEFYFIRDNSNTCLGTISHFNSKMPSISDLIFQSETLLETLHKVITLSKTQKNEKEMYLNNIGSFQCTNQNAENSLELFQLICDNANIYKNLKIEKDRFKEQMSSIRNIICKIKGRKFYSITKNDLTDLQAFTDLIVKINDVINKTNLKIQQAS